MVDTDKRLTCDKAEEIGASIHKRLDWKAYAECSIKRTDQITNLQSLYSNVNIGTEKVSIDPLMLFLRLIVLVERSPEKEIVEAEATVRILDGGALLWCCEWKTGEKFNEIFKRYSNFMKNLGVQTVVFDGYSLSTKNSAHQKRAGVMSQDVDIKDENSCQANRKTFFGNYNNKERFVKALASHLKDEFKVIECPSDADTSIIKESLTVAKRSPVTIFSDDADILCLLIHHVACDSSLKEIFLTNMTKKKGKQREYYKVSDVLNKPENAASKDFILFAHAFTGCDTTSAYTILERHR